MKPYMHVLLKAKHACIFIGVSVYCIILCYLLGFSNENNGRTPLTYAAEHGHEEIVDYLLELGADVNGKFKGAQPNAKKISKKMKISLNVINISCKNSSVRKQENKCNWHLKQLIGYLSCLIIFCTFILVS